MVEKRGIIGSVVGGIIGFAGKVVEFFSGKPKPKYEGNIGYADTSRPPSDEEVYTVRDKTGLGGGAITEMLTPEKEVSADELETATVEEALADDSLPIKYKNLIKRLVELAEAKVKKEVDSEALLELIKRRPEFIEEKDAFITAIKTAYNLGQRKDLSYDVMISEFSYTTDEYNIYATVELLGTVYYTLTQVETNTKLRRFDVVVPWSEYFAFVGV